MTLLSSFASHKLFDYRLGSELKPNVIIGGIACTIETYEDTKIVCVTEARAKGSIMAQVDSKIYFSV